MTILPNAFPDEVSQDVRDFLQHYFDQSNSSSTHRDDHGDEQYFASLFTEVGVYDFMGRKAQGRQAIEQLRHEMFGNVPHRDHRAIKFFCHGTHDLELMVHGEVDYVHHSGQQHWQEWFARYILIRTDEGLKFKLLAVFANPDQQDGHR